MVNEALTIFHTFVCQATYAYRVSLFFGQKRVSGFGCRVHCALNEGSKGLASGSEGYSIVATKYIYIRNPGQRLYFAPVHPQAVLAAPEVYVLPFPFFNTSRKRLDTSLSRARRFIFSPQTFVRHEKTLYPILSISQNISEDFTSACEIKIYMHHKLCHSKKN